MSTSSDTLLPQLRFPPTDGVKGISGALSDRDVECDTVGTRQHIYLPPLVDSNLVIHYRQTDFHVHSLVLLTQSTYFRSYLSAQPPLKEVQVEEVGEEGKKRRRITTFTSLETCAKCGPSSITRCIDLPREFGIHPTTDGFADETEFLLFLRHLYFASTHHLPPWVPKTALVSALTDDTPVCLTFPSTPVSDADITAYAHTEDSGSQWSEQLLSLFHNFDCQAALRRCDAVLASMARIDSVVGLLDAWDFLPVAARYGLQQAEAACLKRVGADSDIRLEDIDYQRPLSKLSPAIKDRVIEAMSIHIDSLNKKIGKRG